MQPALDTNSLLSTAPPVIDLGIAKAVGRFEYGLDGDCQPLTGERDANFMIGAQGQRRAVIKFINAAESPAETACQIAVLRHLSTTECAALTPIALRTRARRDEFETQTVDGKPVRGRAYSFLEGKSAAGIVTNNTQRRHLAQALATFDKALSDFSHPGIARPLLWDVMRLDSLAPLLTHIDDAALRAFAGEYLAAFTSTLKPRLSGLRHQAIHNDMSKSNFLYDPVDGDAVRGILDFGDMAYAPLIADLAIAASYQINDAEEPVQALDEMVSAYHAVLPLSEEERGLVFDLVVARLVQRLAITEWRAFAFPENRTYILRHNPEARMLLSRLIPAWRMHAAARTSA